MDSTAEIKDNRTFVPVKYIAEAVGADVLFDIF
nr:stalk domain-containing protein [Ruminiclostridium cellulolyticum]